MCGAGVFFINTLGVCGRLHATRDSYRGRDRRQNRDDDLNDVLDGFLFHMEPPLPYGHFFCPYGAKRHPSGCRAPPNGEKGFALWAAHEGEMRFIDG